FFFVAFVASWRLEIGRATCFSRSAAVRMILVIAEQRNGKLNRATWETVAAAQQLAGASESPVMVLVPGANGAGAASEVAAAQVNDVVTLAHPALEPYTPDGFTALMHAAIAQL